ncbi:ABC transporter permease [Phaeacidiphilus oryzae]|uniref:ABC transporter permease n=1 Tax=Phaeacidiphilus oryzae TaxID=348818 RepID=UPI00190F922A|nr:ABC transporter permease [Phaeacidiphilus oryzae]
MTRVDEARGTERARGTDRVREIAAATGRGLVRRRELSIFVVCLAAAVYFAVTSTGFTSTGNYHTIAQYVAPWIIVACGETMLLVCGQIDLSAGFVFTLAPFLVTTFTGDGLPLLAALIVALLLCAGVGLVNGLVHTIFNLASFIVTLGMGFFLEGMSLIASNAQPVAAPASGWLVQVLGKARWSELIWALAIVAVMQVVLSATRFGIGSQAVGSNPIGAAESGIRINRIKIINFIMASTLAGFGGILDGIRVGSFDPTNGGNETMFLAVASAVIGGTALLGGSGTVVGALLGALLLGIVYDGFNLTGVNANAFDVVLGVAIVVAMLLNVYLSIARKRASR